MKPATFFALALGLGGLLGTSSTVLGEEPGTPSVSDELRHLNYFIGSWRETSVSEDGTESIAIASFEWSNAQNFISFAYRTARNGDVLLREIIGWDPLSEQVTSWGFGLYGGYWRMPWNEAGDGSWVIETDEEEPWVTWDGDTRSMRSVVTIVDDDHFRRETWWDEAKQSTREYERL